MKAAAPLAVAILLAGCAQPKLLRHYESVAYGQQTREVELSVFVVAPSSTEGAPLLAGVSERGQAALIGALAAKADKPEDLVRLLQSPPPQAAKSCAWAVKDSMTRRLVISLLGDLRTPADRVDKLDVVLTLSPTKEGGKMRPARASFVSWDKFESISKPYEIGTATFGQSSKLTVGNSRDTTTNLADSAGSIAKSLSLGGEIDRSWEESAKYGLTRLSVGGSLTATTARLVQEGGPNYTLFGASSATISMSLRTGDDPRGAHSFTLLKDGKRLAAGDVKVERCVDTYPVRALPIEARVSGRILVREVQSGDGTVLEGDDHVFMRWVSLPERSVTLADARSLEVNRFGLGRCSSSEKIASCEMLLIEHDGARRGEVEPVALAKDDDVIALRDWLATQPRAATTRSIGGLAIGIAHVGRVGAAADLKGVRPIDARGLRVMLLHTNQPPQELSPDQR